MMSALLPRVSLPFDDPIKEAEKVYTKARHRELELQLRFKRSGTWEDRMAFVEAKSKADQLRQVWFWLLGAE